MNINIFGFGSDEYEIVKLQARRLYLATCMAITKAHANRPPLKVGLSSARALTT